MPRGSRSLQSSATVAARRFIFAQLRRFAAVDAVRVADDAALPALAEDLRQAYRRNRVRAEHIEKKAPRPDARQLVGVANEYEAAALRQRL